MDLIIVTRNETDLPCFSKIALAQYFNAASMPWVTKMTAAPLSFKRSMRGVAFLLEENVAHSQGFIDH